MYQDESTAGGLLPSSLRFVFMHARPHTLTLNHGHLPLLSPLLQDFRAVEGCVSAATLQQLGKLQDLVRLDVYGGTGCCRHAGKFEATPQQFAAVLGQMTGLQELGLRGFELLPEPEAEPEFELQNGLNGLSVEERAGVVNAGANGVNGTCSRSSSNASDGSSISSGARARQGLATVMQAIAHL
jgi:hypothetical protein